MPKSTLLTWLLAAGSAAVTVAIGQVRSFFRKSQNRENRRSRIEPQDGSLVLASNPFDHLVSAEDALRLRTVTAELFAHRAHVRELEDEVHRRQQELARLREEQALLSKEQALLSEEIANCAPLPEPHASTASLDLAAAAA
ncbi:TPA: hypothetical protein ACH3X3_009726 [Trebouxia sp. C0006]